MIYNPDSKENVAKVAESFRLMALSPATVDRPLREVDMVVLILDWALACVQEQSARIANLEARLATLSPEGA